MAILTKVGTIVKTAFFIQPPYEQVVTLGWRPKGVIFWGVGVTDSAGAHDIRTGVGGHFGAVDGLSNPDATKGHSWFSTHNVGTSNTGSASSFDPIWINTPNGNLSRGTVVLTDTGFTITWNTNASSAEESLIHYWAFGGDARIKVVPWVLAPSDVGVDRRVGGVGFAPAAVIHFTRRVGPASPGVGCSDANGRQWATTTLSQDSAAVSNTQTMHLVDACIAGVAGNLTVSHKALHVGFDADVFTVKPITVVDNMHVLSVAIGGVLARAGTLTKSNAAAPVTQSVGVGFRSGAVMMVGTQDTSSGVGTAHSTLVVGASDGSGEAVAAWRDIDNQDPMVVRAASNTAKGFAEIANAATLTASADVSMTASDLVLSWDVNNANSTIVSYLAVGDSQHALYGSADVQFQAEGIARADNSLEGALAMAFRAGRSPSQGIWGEAWLGPSHVITSAPAAMAFQTAAKLRLNLSGRLAGSASVAFQASGRLVLTHPLTGGATISLDADAAFGSRHNLEASASLVFGAGASLSLGASLAGASNILSFAAAAELTVQPPYPRRHANDELPGTVNLVRNPSVESPIVGSTDWFKVGSSTTEQGRITTDAWQGNACYQVTCPGVGAGEGLGVRTAQGMGLPGQDLSFACQVRVKGTAGVPVVPHPVVYYTDGTTGTNPGEVVTLTGSWQTIRHQISSDPTKIIRYVEFHILASGTHAMTLKGDGAQVEVDQGGGHTPFAIGDYGRPYHRWEGTEHLSFTVRDPIKMDTNTAGTGGVYTIHASLWRSNADGERLEDLSDHVIKGSVTVDTSQEISRTFTCEMDERGYNQLRPWFDWVSPVLTVMAPDGTERKGQLGHYVVLPSGGASREWGRKTVTLRAMPPEYLLQLQSFNRPFKVMENTQRDRVIREILDGSFTTESGRKRSRFSIPDYENRFGKSHRWTRKDNKLAIINEIATAMSCTSMASDNRGDLFTLRNKDRRFAKQHPVRVWAANIPDDKPLPGWVRRLKGRRLRDREIVGDVVTQIKDEDAANAVRVTSSPPRGPRWGHTRNLNHWSNPISTKRRRMFVFRHVPIPTLDRQDDAEDLAEAIAEDISTRIETVTMSVLPDPSVDLTHRTVYLAIYTQRGEPVAVGHYRVLTVEYGFTPDDALQRMTLGRIHRHEQIEGNDDDHVRLEIDEGNVRFGVG